MDANAPPTQAGAVLNAVAFEAGLELGTVLLGRYEIRQVLGRGAFGQVLEVRDAHSGVDYALKRLPPELAVNETLMAGILANFALVSRLAHEHIGTTRFVEVDKATGQVYVIMDLVRGVNLRRWLVNQGVANEPISIETVLGFAEQLADALDYAHSQATSRGTDGKPKRYGIVHRDLKPENILVENNVEFRPGVPNLRIVDFGLAAEIQKSIQSISEVGRNRLAGTPFYISPEQWEGKALTRGVDQWALRPGSCPVIPWEDGASSLLSTSVEEDTPLLIRALSKRLGRFYRTYETYRTYMSH